MSKRGRKQYDGRFKARVAVEALKGGRTMNEIAGAYRIHPVQVSQWKAQALEVLPAAMADRRGRDERAREEERAELFQEIGKLKVELDWLKEKSGLSREGSA